MGIFIQNIREVNYIIQAIFINFLPITATVFLMLYIKLNNPYESKYSGIFRRLIMYVILLIIFDNIELYNAEYGIYNSGIMTLSTALGYIIRLCVFLSVIRILHRYDKPSLPLMVVLLMPFVITVVLSLTAIMGFHVMFWYEAGGFHRGPLSYTPHIASIIYGIYLIAITCRMLRNRNRKEEGITAMATVVVMFIATGFETVYQIHGILVGMIAMSLTFYYLYIYIEHFKLDELTGVLNRASFNADIRKYKKKITGLVSIDLNGLKQINDNKGHLDGDKAIKTTAEVITNNLIRNCYVYRVGGDEFFLICVKVTKDKIESMMNLIMNEMQNTPYSCSMGLSMWESGMDFEECYTEADKNMYKQKQEMKKSLQENK